MKKIALGILAASILAIPVVANRSVESGLNIGETLSAFHPTHIAGPDKGTDTCPPCKYGNRPAVQVWVNEDSPENVLAIANNLQAKVASSKNEFKAFIINVTCCDVCTKAAENLAKNVKGNELGITVLDPKNSAVKQYKVNLDKEVKNTVFVYKNRKVVAKFINLKADREGLNALNEAITKIDQ